MKDTTAFAYGPNNLQYITAGGNASHSSIVPEFHHIQNCAFDNNRYGGAGGGGFAGRPTTTNMFGSSGTSEADRHFLSGPLITSTTSYEHFLSSNRHHSVTDGAIEHSGELCLPQ